MLLLLVGPTGRAAWHRVLGNKLEVADFRITDGPFDCKKRRGLSDSRQRHRPVGSEAECDGLEDFPCARRIDNASCLAVELPDRAGDMLLDQAVSGAAWRRSQSKLHLHFIEKLIPLRLRETIDQPGEARQ